LQGIEIACNGGPAVFSRQFGVVDLFSVEIGSCDGQTMIDVENGGHVNITGNLFVAGNAAAFVISRGESAQFLAGTVTINGSANLNIGYFVDIDGHSQADFSAAGLQFTGFGNLIGTKFIAANLGELRTGGRCSTGSPGSSTFLPGSSGGSLLNGAICD
jgi:hypothetical protein